ncbi:RDD family protein [Mycolicibacterium parafortuitum]|uniref:RDD family protein n=1 Tax=Mycolicibacterium parafortuitum TaxID=39692 RepID=A0A7I7TZB1_MYCPF|nr:RDD family protein [Mycolicibacterium parafortuitum]BBY74344.1 RDD family protein [Mycolicibacterium parafortuitum]
MTAVLNTSEVLPDQSAEAPLASWPARAGALAVDILPGLGVLAVSVLLALTAPFDSVARWVFTAVAAVVFVLMVANRVVMPAVKGWTLGRALFGIEVRRADGGRPGLGRLAVRELAHLLDTFGLFVGWLWPLWDRRRRTFADMLAGTQVYRVTPPSPEMRRIVGMALAGTAAAAVLVVAVGYAWVYGPARALDNARQQVAAQGPRMVEQMLSFRADNMDEDFARARELTTEGYRDQLVKQQDSVREAGPTNNEYWAVNSAVLTDPPVTENRVSMLLAMQGQRGTNAEDMKFITATVQVEFEKSDDGQWRVGNLTVLKKPMMNTAGQ